MPKKKLCPKCQNEYPATSEYFGENSGRYDGLRSYCNSCNKEYHKEYRRKHYEKHEEEQEKENTDLSGIQKKMCPKCNKEYPATNEYFSKNKNCPDGLDSYCKKCKAEYQKRYNRGNLQYRSIPTKSNIDIKNWKENTAIQKFRKLYLKDLMSKHQIWRKTRLSVGNIEFLAEELGIKLSKKERNKLRKEKEIEHYKSLRPSKEEIEKYYHESNFSIWRVSSQFFPKVPYKHVLQWFNDLKIVRRHPIRYISKEDRIQKIIGQLESKL